MAGVGWFGMVIVSRCGMVRDGYCCQVYTVATVVIGCYCREVAVIKQHLLGLVELMLQLRSCRFLMDSKSWMEPNCIEQTPNLISNLVM